MHSKGTVTSAGSTDTLRMNVGVRTMEEQRNLNVHSVERNIMDSVGQGVTHHSIKIHRKEDGKETEKETAREPRKEESLKVEKTETVGKEKVKERKDNVSTKSQNHQRNSGQVDLTPTLGGWDLTMKSEPPERANKIMNNAIQEISAKKRSAATAKDFRAVTDTERLVTITDVILSSGRVSACKTGDSNKWH